MRTFRLCAAVCLSVCLPAGAADRWFLQNRGYYDPVLAEPRSAQTEVLFPGVSSSFPFAVNPGRGVVWDISLGKEIPILGFESNGAAQTGGGVPQNSWGFGVWFPLSFHMIEDMGKDPSNPILNTDYRFSGQLKAQYAFKSHGKLSTPRVGVKFQFGHESTHLGDEFTLGALRTHFAEFQRVNVSYEYYDFGASFEPNFGGGRYRLKLRGGNIWLWNPDKGWYSRELLQPFGKFIAGSQRNHEPYGQIELVTPSPSPTFNFIVSADIRDRTIYQYAPALTATVTNRAEPTQVSINSMFGVRQLRQGTGLLGMITPTYYLRYYHGVNPNGQFRSQDNFQLVGFGVQFGF